MNKPKVSDVLEMNVAERILFVEDIWDSIASVPETVNLTESQRKELDQRLEMYHRNPDEGSAWEDVKQRILKKL
ncbi:addiction module protein [candidate division KSB1 bacterium]|nr:addiction module protein [candidate division KSB1 bacterium]